MPAQVSAFRTPIGPRGVVLSAAGLTAAFLANPVCATAAPGPSAAPVAAVAAATPTCTRIEPATLTAEVTQPQTIWDNVGVTFSGTLHDPVPAGACVVIPATPTLPLRTFGAYPAADPEGARVGTMHVDPTGITFTFDDHYVKGRTNVSFQGRVLAGIRADTTTTINPFTLNWAVPGISRPIVVNAPGCPTCSSLPPGGSKYADVIDAKREVHSGITLGVKDWDRIPATGDDGIVDITMRDALGAGQVCRSATWHDLTHQRTTSVPCDPLSITFKATRGHAYLLTIVASITDATLPSYADTGTISVDGLTILKTTVNAAWHNGSAHGQGTTAVTPTATPTPSPTTTSPTPTASRPTSSPTPSSATPTPTPSPAPSSTTTAPTSNPAPSPVVPTLSQIVVPPFTSTTGTSTPTPATSTPTTPTPTTTPTRAPAPTFIPSTPTVQFPHFVPTVRRVFQVDRLTPRTTAQAHLVARLDDDRLLRYREDRGLWRVSRHQFVTLNVPVNASPNWIITQLNAHTKPAVGDVRRTGKLASALAGHTYVLAWELAKGATVRHPWGPNKDTAQRFFARS